MAVKNGEVTAALELPIAGIISDKNAEILITKLEKLHQSANLLSTSLHDPFMSLAFLALPVIPKLKLTDYGLIDVEKFEVTDLFVKE